MDPENRPEQDAPETEPNLTPPQEKPTSSYSTKTRILAWLGVAFMVFLTIMYAYSFATGKIMEW